MAFFDEFSEKAKGLADAAAGKAKEAMDSAKVTAAIVAEQRALEKSCKTIGEWYLAQKVEDVPEEIAEAVAAARASEEKLEELKAARQKAEAEPEKTERACPLCGAMSDGKFCPQCGAPMGD